MERQISMRDTDMPPDAAPAFARRTVALAEAAAGDATSARAVRFAWARHWEFWLALVLGAVLRLWRLDVTSFLTDQAALMGLARDGVLQHALPVTGIPSSIHTLNPPLSIYLLLPFAAFGRDPFLPVLSLALWNVLGVALCYIFALRFFGRRAAAIGTLLFATCGAAVGYSRFLWQQNYLPPLLVLWALAIYAGCVRGTRGAFVWGFVLLAAAAQLHPTAALLLPVMAVALLLAPRRPHAWEYVLSLCVIGLLFAPTLVWEWVSSGSDLHTFTSYSAGHSMLDPAVLFRLYEALGGPVVTLNPLRSTPIPRSPTAALALIANMAAQQPLGHASPYALLQPLYLPLALAATLLFCIGWLVLSARVFAPAVALWRGRDREARVMRQLGALAITLWHGLRDDAALRPYLLLWLGVTLPPVLLLRHSSSIFTHYLLALFPFAFIVSGLGAAWLIAWAARWRVAAQPSDMPSATGRASVPLRWKVRALAVAAALCLLIVGQAAQSLLFTGSLAAGQFDARAIGYGYPLGALEQADTALEAAQRRSGARTVYVMEPLSLAEPLNYLLVREQPDRVGLIDSCLVLPAPDAGPTLVVATNTAAPPEQLLAELPNAMRMADIPMLGNRPLATYRITGTLGRLADETAIGPITFADSRGARIRLDAIARAANGDLRLRWTVLAQPPDQANPISFRMLTRSQRADGSVGRVLGFRDCEPSIWRGGETVFTWLPAPASWTELPNQTQRDPVLVQVQESVAARATATVGPVHILADSVERTPWSPLVPSSHSISGSASGGMVQPLGFITTYGDELGSTVIQR